MPNFKSVQEIRYYTDVQNTLDVLKYYYVVTHQVQKRKRIDAIKKYLRSMFYDTTIEIDDETV